MLPEARTARRVARDGVLVVLGGQVERVLGVVTALALRWWLDPARMGVYTGLRLFLDNTNRSSLGVGLGAVQEIPILRGAGRFAEAERVARVAHTVNTVTAFCYAVGLLGWAWWRSELLRGTPLAAEWTWGLAIVALLALLKRYETFLIALHRAHHEFGLTTRVDILESLVSAAAVTCGLLLWGFWGLLAAVGVIVWAKIAYLHGSHPLRLRWGWDGAIARRLIAKGLPILLNTAAFGCVLGIDRFVILTQVENSELAVGLYSIAVLGTSWCLDLSGRVVLVLYPYLQTELGRTEDPVHVSRRAARSTEVLAPLLAAGASAAYVLFPDLLAVVVPRYAEGVCALRALMPGALFLALTWPARQLLVALGRPWRLLAATLVGLSVLAAAAFLGARAAGLMGVAMAMGVGGPIVFATTAMAAFGLHLAREEVWEWAFGLLVPIGYAALVAVSAAYVPLGGFAPVVAWLVRGVLVAVGLLPLGAAWLVRNRGLFEGGLRAGGEEAGLS